MREGSYTQIEKGMRVIGRDEATLGAVSEVISDEASGIFIGLAVSPNLFTHPLLVPGELVERVHDGVVYVNASQADLRPYNTPEERLHDSQEAYEGVIPS